MRLSLTFPEAIVVSVVALGLITTALGLQLSGFVVLVISTCLLGHLAHDLASKYLSHKTNALQFDIQKHTQDKGTVEHLQAQLDTLKTQVQASQMFKR